MSIIGNFTGDNRKIQKGESLVNEGSYKEALNVFSDINPLVISNQDFCKVQYLTAYCEFKLGKYGEALRSIVWILNVPGGAGIYENKAKSLQRQISEQQHVLQESTNSITFPSCSFSNFIEDCYSFSDVEESRIREGVNENQYYIKIQIPDREHCKLFTFYWKPVRSYGGDLFVYLGKEIDDFCKKIDENAIEKYVYRKSFKNLCNLYKRGEKGVGFAVSLYRTEDFAKPSPSIQDLKGNTYVLGMKVSQKLPSCMDGLESEIEELFKATSNIIEDLSQDVPSSDKAKIYAAYIVQGALGKVATSEFHELGKLLTCLLKK